MRQIFSANFYRRERICHSCDPVEWVLLSLGGSQDHRFPPGHGKPNCMSTNQWKGWFARDGNWEWCNYGIFQMLFKMFSVAVCSLWSKSSHGISVWRTWPPVATEGCLFWSRSVVIPWLCVEDVPKEYHQNIINRELQPQCSVFHIKPRGLDLRTSECQWKALISLGVSRVLFRKAAGKIWQNWEFWWECLVTENSQVTFCQKRNQMSAF